MSMSTLHTINGQPVQNPTTTAAAEVAELKNDGIDATATAGGVEVTVPSPTHAKECGIVGKTGKHGILGTNAAK